MTSGRAVPRVQAMAGPLAGGSYVIVVGATLGRDWGSWFDGFEVETFGQSTRLSGEVADQAALHGVLARLRDLGIPILEVQRVFVDDGAPVVDDPQNERNTPAGT